jgi:2-dehydro-3-deoxyphosphooctonate aldolase (KDO 8-P synthase)
MKFKVIAGPCQHESLEHSLKVIEWCKTIAFNKGFEYYFKTSFDKANRTSIHSKRGLGLEQTLIDFAEMKSQIPKLNILTDVHERDQIRKVAGLVDVIQIPAFLCRQTDLIREACDSGCIVNIKKGQFLSPWEVDGIISKTEGAKEVWITERGTSFGYNNLVVDMRSLHIMKEAGYTVIFDGTHSVQAPGGQGTSSGGNRNHVEPLCRAAVAVGVDGLFMEVHNDPDNAPSDGPNMLTFSMYNDVMAVTEKILGATRD